MSNGKLGKEDGQAANSPSAFSINQPEGQKVMAETQWGIIEHQPILGHLISPRYISCCTGGILLLVHSHLIVTVK